MPYGSAAGGTLAYTGLAMGHVWLAASAWAVSHLVEIVTTLSSTGRRAS